MPIYRIFDLNREDAVREKSVALLERIKVAMENRDKRGKAGR